MAHNARRRDNRAIKRALVDGARRAGHPDQAVKDLERANPKVVKDWAEAQGLNPADFLNSNPPPVPHPGAQLHVPPPAAAGAPPATTTGLKPVVGAPGAALGPVPGAGAGRFPLLAPVPAQSGWQSAWWTTPELLSQIDALEHQQGGHRDERSLLFGKVAGTQRPRGKGTNETVRVELDNGVIGYHKPFDGLNTSIAQGFGQTSAEQSVHEVVAWQVAREMGPPWSELVPPCIVREVEGRMGSFAIERGGKGGHRAFDVAPEWREAAFFDALIGQQDRHHENWLMAGDRITLIDHGYAFARSGDYCNWSMLTDRRAATEPMLTHQERDSLERLLNSSDLFGLEKTLPPDRAQAIRARAERMRTSGRILGRGDY